MSGFVYVTQSTIFGAPLVVVANAGWSNVIPVSSTPTVTPRPSHVGWASRNVAAPVSAIGMYGLCRPVPAPGAGNGVGAI